MLRAATLSVHSSPRADADVLVLSGRNQARMAADDCLGHRRRWRGVAGPHAERGTPPGAAWLAVLVTRDDGDRADRADLDRVPSLCRLVASAAARSRDAACRIGAGGGAGLDLGPQSQLGLFLAAPVALA